MQATSAQKVSDGLGPGQSLEMENGTYQLTKSFCATSTPTSNLRHGILLGKARKKLPARAFPRASVRAIICFIICSEKLELLEKLGKARSCLGVCGAYVVTAQLLRTCCDLLFVVLTVEGGVFCYDEHNYTSTTGPWRGSEGSQGSADAEGRRSSALAGNVRRGPLHLCRFKLPLA